MRNPTIDEKLRILHLIDALGIDTADIGLPGAGPHVVRDVERLAREIAEQRLRVRANCAARTLVADIGPIVEISQRVGHADRVRRLHRLEPAPAVRRRLGASTSCCELTEEAVTFAVREGLPVMYVTEDTTRADPETLRRLYSTAIRAGASRVCIADTVGHATPAGAAAVVRFVAGGRRGVRRRRRHRLARPPRPRLRGDRTRWPRSRPARRGCTAPAIGIGERVGNTPMDMLLVNLVLMGYIERDLSPLVEYCETVSAATGVPIPPNYPVVGRDAFRTATGVHAAAVIKAFRKQRSGAGRRRLFRRAGEPGRPRAGDRGRPDVREVERGVLAGEARPAGDRRGRRADLREGEGVGDGAAKREIRGAMLLADDRTWPARA